MKYLIATQEKVSNKALLKTVPLAIIHPGTNIQVSKFPATKFAGYVSVGECPPELVQDITTFSLKTLGAKNEEFDSTLIDFRDLKWTDYLISQRIAAVKNKGCTMAFLDTADVVSDCMDNAITATESNTYRNCGIEMIIKLSQQMPVIVNRGFGMFPDILSFVWGILDESLFHKYYHKKDGSIGYKDTTEDDRKWTIERLNVAKQAGKPIFICDFFSSEDKALAKVYTQKAKELGFNYLATPKGFNGTSLV